MYSLKFVITAFVALLVSCSSLEDEESAARLLISKHILNKYLVQDMDIVIKVSCQIVFLFSTVIFKFHVFFVS